VPGPGPKTKTTTKLGFEAKSISTKPKKKLILEKKTKF
jgi:hypothetical protein